MARFTKNHDPVVVTAFRSGIDDDPSWYKRPNAKKDQPKLGDWVVKDGDEISFKSKAQMNEGYRMVR